VVTGIEPTTSGLLDQRPSRLDNQAPEKTTGLEDFGVDDIARPHFELKTCVWFRVEASGEGRFFPQSVLSPSAKRRLRDLLVLQGTTKSTKKKLQEKTVKC